ncbi:MAG: hypothetical protein CL471_13520 [Acidobacteria bacterium]|jgi:hypothetical protein|nr:hypothetical protein [Acidobacteriota bacterium]|tara:strand:- start:5285 stop:5740 length:456 start_codon:yes stop_codon:yes gene_type:complete
MPLESTAALRRRETAERWHHLEGLDDACAVVTRRMEVVYLNETARSLAVDDWYGRPCWHVLPVRDPSCVWTCAAVRAVSLAESLYCEETIYPKHGAPVTLGVGVVPVGEDSTRGDALLLLRLKSPGGGNDGFRQEVIRAAEDLQARVPTGR